MWGYFVGRNGLQLRLIPFNLGKNNSEGLFFEYKEACRTHPMSGSLRY